MPCAQLYGRFRRQVTFCQTKDLPTWSSFPVDLKFQNLRTPLGLLLSVADVYG